MIRVASRPIARAVRALAIRFYGQWQFSYPLMIAIQEISARIGRTTGRGIAANLAGHYPNGLLQVVVVASSRCFQAHPG